MAAAPPGCVASADLPLPATPSCRRAYTQKKIQENVQCEIMHVIVEEATDSYRWVAWLGASVVWGMGGTGAVTQCSSAVTTTLLTVVGIAACR